MTTPQPTIFNNRIFGKNYATQHIILAPSKYATGQPNSARLSFLSAPQNYAKTSVTLTYINSPVLENLTITDTEPNTISIAYDTPNQPYTSFTATISSPAANYTNTINYSATENPQKGLTFTHLAPKTPYTITISGTTYFQQYAILSTIATTLDYPPYVTAVTFGNINTNLVEISAISIQYTYDTTLIYRNSSLIATNPALPFEDTGLQPNTQYIYTFITLIFASSLL